MRYTTDDGNTVEVTPFETNAGVSVYGVEIIDGAGEVIEYMSDLSRVRLAALVASRGWRFVA